MYIPLSELIKKMDEEKNTLKPVEIDENEDGEDLEAN